MPPSRAGPPTCAIPVVVTIGLLVDGSRSPSLRAAARRAASLRASPGAVRCLDRQPGAQRGEVGELRLQRLALDGRTEQRPAGCRRRDERRRAHDGREHGQCRNSTKGAFAQSARGMPRPYSPPTMLTRHGRLAAAGRRSDRERRGTGRRRRRAAEDRSHRAHESGDRRNAPLLCYLIGRMQSGPPAVGRSSTLKEACADPARKPSSRSRTCTRPASHPESQQRMTVLHERFPFVECGPAS